MNTRPPSLLAFAATLLVTSAVRAETPYLAEAKEVTASIQQTFYQPKTGRYLDKTGEKRAAYMWGDGVMLSALNAAARYEPATYRPVLDNFVKALDGYWDPRDKVPGYEPAPTNGGGNDKYYDDNAWIAIALAETYDLTGDARYLRRARETQAFVLSGWDDQLGGGIWWHEAHKGDCKNTCVNAPAAVACLRLAREVPPREAADYVAESQKIVDWTTATFQAPDGLFKDSETVTTKKMNGGKLTYNTALMLRAELGLYRQTGDRKHLEAAERMGKAADGFVDKKTGAYRDLNKWSHLMAEADVELYRTAGDAHALDRAKAYADHTYAQWKAKPSNEMIEQASLARTLWLLADTQTAAGKAFWAKEDRAANVGPPRR